jgi:hypothetical protein
VTDLVFDHPVQQDMLDHWTVLGCSQECREALKEEIEGLPFAKPLSGGRDPEWLDTRVVPRNRFPECWSIHSLKAYATNIR